MKNLILKNFGFLIIFLFVISCSNDDIPAHIHDHDAIHELVLEQTDVNGENPVRYEFIHGNPSGDLIQLVSGQTYNFEIIELNVEHDDHHHNIINEVLEAIEEHFFLYSKSSSLDIEMLRMDNDDAIQNDGTQIGLKTRITANAVSQGNLQIELKHQSSEMNDQANDNFGSVIGGATDVLAIFPVIIE